MFLYALWVQYNKNRDTIKKSGKHGENSHTHKYILQPKIPSPTSAANGFDHVEMRGCGPLAEADGQGRHIGAARREGAAKGGIAKNILLIQQTAAAAAAGCCCAKTAFA